MNSYSESLQPDTGCLFCLFVTCSPPGHPGVEISCFSGLFLSTEVTVNTVLSTLCQRAPGI